MCSHHLNSLAHHWHARSSPSPIIHLAGEVAWPGCCCSWHLQCWFEMLNNDCRSWSLLVMVLTECGSVVVGGHVTEVALACCVKKREGVGEGSNCAPELMWMVTMIVSSPSGNCGMSIDVPGHCHQLLGCWHCHIVIVISVCDGGYINILLNLTSLLTTYPWLTLPKTPNPCQEFRFFEGQKILTSTLTLLTLTCVPLRVCKPLYNTKKNAVFWQNLYNFFQNIFFRAV